MRKALTLVEVLVVIAIIAVVAAILFPVFSNARQSARASTCLSNVRQIGSAIFHYAADNDDGYPFQVIGVNEWLSRIGLTTESSFGMHIPRLRCPDRVQPPEPSPLDVSGYAFNACLVPHRPIEPSRTVLVGEVATFHPINAPTQSIFSEHLEMPDSYLVDRSQWIVDEYGSRYAPYGEWGARRHRGRSNTIFCDGSARSLPPEAFRIPSAGFPCVKRPPGWLGPASGPVFNPAGVL